MIKYNRKNISDIDTVLLFLKNVGTVFEHVFTAGVISTWKVKKKRLKKITSYSQRIVK